MKQFFTVFRAVCGTNINFSIWRCPLRIIGITHRVKQKIVNGEKSEESPTLVAIKNESGITQYALKTETDELDFLMGRFPTSWKEVREGEDLTGVLSRYVKEPQKEDGRRKAPASYEGYARGDIVLMPLGGSGDCFAFALSRRGEEIGSRIFRLPPHILKEKRDESEKDKDVELLIAIFAALPNLFYEVTPRERDLILVREQFRARMDAQQARLACEQRLRQRAIGRVFLSEEGKYPEGTVEDIYDAQKASDEILANLKAAEKEEDAVLSRAVERVPVFGILDGVEGCGVAIASRLIAAIGDVSRFPNEAKLKAFCGAHVMEDGRFPRRRRGQRCNWNPIARQALYLLADQFNRRPGSVWGQRLLMYKKKLRVAHPVVLCKECGVPRDECGQKSHKRLYSNGHIHKMAMWRTMTKFVEWLYREWTRLERAEQVNKKAA